MTISEVLSLKPIGFLTPTLQILIICLLFILTTFIQYREYKKLGKVWVHYPVNNFILFVPIYEEIIFRGFIFVGLIHLYGLVTAIIFSSLLFGLWHLKNIFYHTGKSLVWQIFYTGFIFGPIVAVITFFTGTIWLGVIIHFCNNLLAQKAMLKFGNH